MGRPRGASTRILSTEDRGGAGEGRYRVRYLLEGRKSSIGFATEREAKAFVRKFEAEYASQTGPTVAEALGLWLADRKAQGFREYPYHRRWPVECLREVMDEPVAALVGPAFEAGYIQFADRVAADTSRLGLICLRQFGAWLVARRYLREDPASTLKPRGVRKRGKPQFLTEREMLAFQGEAFRRARAGDVCALAALLGLFCGLRSCEVRALEGKHVDLHRIIRVPATKTERGRPVKVLIDEMWGMVEERAASGGKLVPRGWKALVESVKSIGRAAGVSNADDLVFHSLRGAFATLATEKLAAFEAVAAAMGHTSYVITGAHYATPESQAEAGARARLRVLTGGRE
jgi:integrase